MILVDRVLEQRHREDRPIRVGMVGAGFMARGIALQILQSVPGMYLAAIANRHVANALHLFRESGAEAVQHVKTVAQLEDSARTRGHAVTDDPLLLCQAPSIDVVIEVTGNVELGANVALEAIRHGKHVVLMNAELEGTIGPILQHHARRSGVVVTNADGDQPGVLMNLYRFVRGIGVRPVLCGNIKGLHDPYRTPTTQAAFAEKWGQNPRMVTSFADGTKISFEQAIVANATGMRVATRGMFGPTVPDGTPITQATELFPTDLLLQGSGFVDYVVGAVPSPGVFVLGTHDNPLQRHYLNLYKLGEGPLYCFYTPYHLCHFEVPNTVARAVDFHDAAVAPVGRPLVDVVATAKADLRAGQVIDGLGGYLTYGQCENSEAVHEQDLLPMGLAEGCRLKRDVARDRVLTYADVEIPKGRLSDRLRHEQDTVFNESRNAAPMLRV